MEASGVSGNEEELAEEAEGEGCLSLHKELCIPLSLRSSSSLWILAHVRTPHLV